MLKFEVFIREHLPEDGLPTGAVVTSEVSALEHEILNYPVERRALVAKTVLTGGKLAKVLGSLGNGFVIKFEDDPTGRL